MGYKQKYTAVGQMKGKAAGLVHKSSAVGLQLSGKDITTYKKENIDPFSGNTQSQFVGFDPAKGGTPESQLGTLREQAVKNTGYFDPSKDVYKGKEVYGDKEKTQLLGYKSHSGKFTSIQNLSPKEQKKQKKLFNMDQELFNQGVSKRSAHKQKLISGDARKYDGTEY